MNKQCNNSLEQNKKKKQPQKRKKKHTQNNNNKQNNKKQKQKQKQKQNQNKQKTKQNKHKQTNKFSDKFFMSVETGFKDTHCSRQIAKYILVFRLGLWQRE